MLAKKLCFEDELCDFRLNNLKKILENVVGLKIIILQNV